MTQKTRRTTPYVPWHSSEVESLLAWMETHGALVAGKATKWHRQLKNDVFPDNDRIDVTKIRNKLSNMRKAYKTAALQAVAGDSDPDDPIEDRLDRTCPHYARLDALWNGKVDMTPKAAPPSRQSLATIATPAPDGMAPLAMVPVQQPPQVQIQHDHAADLDELELEDLDEPDGGSDMGSEHGLTRRADFGPVNHVRRAATREHDVETRLQIAEIERDTRVQIAKIEAQARIRVAEMERDARIAESRGRVRIAEIEKGLRRSVSERSRSASPA
ncbi:hypothetical protein EDC01DRAFT_14754 [Geopyxis carbonaria]|nr:hypothetical protein EDC01DRAFT_14754 [Geopyxis carbonaria]